MSRLLAPPRAARPRALRPAAAVRALAGVAAGLVTPVTAVPAAILLPAGAGAQSVGASAKPAPARPATGHPMPADTAAPGGARPGAPGAPPRTLAVLLYPGFTALDAIGPLQMLGMLHMQGWRVVTVGTSRGPVPTDAGYSIEARVALAELPQVDVLVVPGGLEGTYRAARDTALTHWIARVAPRAQAVASVCTGAWVLAGAGVLQRGDTAATHWLGGEELARAGVVYTPARVHRSGPGGRVWTAAGVSAGLDLGLALTEALGGRALAEHAQLLAQYDPHPPLDAGTPEKAPAEAARMRAVHAQLMREIAARERAAPGTAVPEGATPAAGASGAGTPVGSTSAPPRGPRR